MKNAITNKHKEAELSSNSCDFFISDEEEDGRLEEEEEDERN